MSSLLIRKAEFYNFRNYNHLEFQPSAGINFLTGENGSGKSNLIEGLYYFCFSRSFRTFREREIIHWGEHEAGARLLFRVGSKNQEMKISWEKNIEGNIQKRLQVGNYTCKKASEFIGHAVMVLFSPGDLEIVNGPPGRRRKFLDIITTMITPAHISDLSDYRQILLERNRLLTSGEYDQDQMSVWTEKLVEYGSKILYRRLSVLKMLKEHIRKVSSRLEYPISDLSVKYLGSFPIPEDEKLIPLDFRKALDETSTEEKEKMATVVGPHRDELLIRLANKPARIFGSQGQQRMIAIILKISQAELLADKTGIVPLLLLDDCLSELDMKRQKQLWREISSSGQVIITSGHHPPEWVPGDNLTIFEIKGGRLKR
ncbi:MAG: DNA replication/repair protein RecF [Candidatus Eremiobacteraeota bacterium]|nr:DNA replication/repair protein RecF [Candidatus Eremiobacteraeota bacterium]